MEERINISLARNEHFLTRDIYRILKHTIKAPCIMDPKCVSMGVSYPGAEAVVFNYYFDLFPNHYHYGYYQYSISVHTKIPYFFEELEATVIEKVKDTVRVGTRISKRKVYK